MPEVELSAGVIDYEDNGGSGAVIVGLHGVLMNSSAWRDVARDLPADVRFIAPTLPLGGHRRPVSKTADLSPAGVADLVVEFLDRLELQDVTLVGFDTGGAIAQLVVSRHPDRLARLVLVACDAFENFPPGLPGKTITLAARMPGGINAALQPLRWRPMRRLPVSFGWMSNRPVPDDMMDSWLRPALQQAGVRRDLARLLNAVDPKDLLEAATKFGAFEHPVLVVWAKDDRVMAAAHGPRLAEAFPNARLEIVADSGTLIPIDQPAELARLITEFVASPVA